MHSYDDSLLNKGLHISFSNHNRCFCLFVFLIQASFSYVCNMFVFQMIVSDEFLTQCDTEAFLKFNSCFSTEFER